MSHEVSEFERAVRHGAIVNKVRRIMRRRALSLPIPGWWSRTPPRLQRGTPWR